MIVPGLGAEVEWRDGSQIVRFGGREVRAALREFSDLGAILEEQDRSGVDLVVLAPWVNLCGVEIERQNEALAGLVGDRVAALGTVDPANADQLVELMRDARLSGVELPAAPGGDYLGHERFRDFWAAAEETAALVFIHPSTRGFGLPVLDEHYMWNTVGNPVETTVTAAHMVGAGVMDDFPSLRVLLAHGGGALPALRGRLAHEQTIHSPGSCSGEGHAARHAPGMSSGKGLRPPGRDVLAAIARFYVDTVVHDEHVLRGLVDFFGADRVLLGSDYPFDMGTERPAEIVRALALPAEEEAAILGGNAVRLIGRESLV